MHREIPHFTPCSNKEYLRGKNDLTSKGTCNIHWKSVQKCLIARYSVVDATDPSYVNISPEWGNKDTISWEHTRSEICHCWIEWQQPICWYLYYNKRTYRSGHPVTCIILLWSVLNLIKLVDAYTNCSVHFSKERELYWQCYTLNKIIFLRQFCVVVVWSKWKEVLEGQGWRLLCIQ